MVGLRWFGSMPLLTVLLAGSGSRAEEQPKLLPTRDVDVRYDVTRPQQPKVRERVRWLAGERLERVDASGRSTSIFDRDAHVVTLLTPATRTFRKLDKAPRRPSEPEPGAALQRGAEAVVAGLPCTDWSWIEDGEKHIVCVRSFWRLRHTSLPRARKGRDKARAIGRCSSSNTACSPPTRTMAIIS
jgi:hypothetical protein